MSGNAKDSIPELGSKDRVYKVIKHGITVGSWLATLSGIPVGGLPAEFYSAIVKSPIEKRWKFWADSVVERLSKLEYTMEDLSKNDSFITAFMQASQIVLRTHQEAKIDALRNAVVNMASPLFADDNIYLMFLSSIDILTPWHFRVLEFIRSEGPNLESNKPNYHDSGHLIKEIANIFPKDEVDLDLLRQIVNDLSDRGLAKIKMLTQDADGSLAPNSAVTPMGTKFLNFITN